MQDQYITLIEKAFLESFVNSLPVRVTDFYIEEVGDGTLKELTFWNHDDYVIAVRVPTMRGDLRFNGLKDWTHIQLDCLYTIEVRNRNYE